MFYFTHINGCQKRDALSKMIRRTLLAKGARLWAQISICVSPRCMQKQNAELPREFFERYAAYG